MPSKSKQQQKFMGIVRSIQKGEAPAGKFSKAAQKAAKSMEKGSVKKYAKTKHDDLPKKVSESTKAELYKMYSKAMKMMPGSSNQKELEKKISALRKKLGMNEERDYKAEYKKFQSSTKSKKYRAELNKYNRKKGTYGNGDGKDASHKGGKIVGFESESKNRGRAEKSRLKKEVSVTESDLGLTYKKGKTVKVKHKTSGKQLVIVDRPNVRKEYEKIGFFAETQVNELTPPMSVSNPTAYKAMLDKQISKNVKVKTALGNKDHKDHKKAKGLLSRFMDKFKKKKDEPKKSKSTPSSMADFRRSRKESVNENDKVKVLKLLIKRGDNPKDAKKDVQKLYNKVSKMYKNASNSKKAEIISALSAKMSGKGVKSIKLKGKSGMGKISHFGMESVNEASTIDKIKDIVKNKQNMKIGGVRVDMQTANAIMTVHKALGQSNRKKYEKLPIKKMASVAFKLLK